MEEGQEEKKKAAEENERRSVQRKIEKEANKDNEGRGDRGSGGRSGWRKR